MHLRTPSFSNFLVEHAPMCSITWQQKKEKYFDHNLICFHKKFVDSIPMR